MEQNTITKTIAINDIFYATWGYEQTNIDFVKVIEISKSGKSVIAVSIGQKTIEATSSMSENVIANPDSEVSKPFRLKVEYNKEEPQLRGSYIYCGESKRLDSLYLWKGEKLYQSHYA